MPVRYGKLVGDQVIQPHSTLGIDPHHALPGSSRIANGAGHGQLLIEDLINGKLNVLPADGYLRVTSHGTQRFQASAHRAGMPRALEGHIHTYTVGVLQNRFIEVLLPYVDNGGGANAERGIQPVLVS